MTLLQKVHEKQHDKTQVNEFLSLKNSPFRSLLTFDLSLHLTQKPLSDRLDKALKFRSQAEHSNCHLYCFCVLAGRGTNEEALVGGRLDQRSINRRCHGTIAFGH